MMIKRWSLVLFLLVFAPVTAGFAPRQQDLSHVDLVLEVGYEGYFRQGQWIPVKVLATNNGPAVEGDLRVRTGGIGGLAETTYRTPINLAQDVRKQVFLYISFESFSPRIQVEVVDRAGQVFGVAEARLHMLNPNDVMMAVVTESATGAVDLTGAAPGTGNAFQVRWQVEDIPPLADALAGLDVLLFHEVDTGALRPEQVDAIKGWVLRGGHLIVATGDFWQRTTAGLDDLLPADPEGTMPAETLAPLAAYLRIEPDVLEGGTTLTRLVLRPGARTLVGVDEGPVLVRGGYGSGTVDLLAVDPQAEPLRSWTGSDRLWHTLLSTTGQRPSWLGTNKSWSMAREATLTTASTALPSFSQLCGFLLLYIVLIGPVNYLVLKRLNRREWAWVTIPLLIVLFSGLAYTIGFSLRGSLPTLNRLGAIYLWPSSDEAYTSGMVGIQSPRRATYNLTGGDDVTLRVLPHLGTGLSVPVTITQGQRHLVEGVPVDAGMVASFAASGTTPAPHLEASATWQLSHADSPRVRGSVTNTLDTPLEDAVVLYKGGSHYLGTLEPGDTGSFNVHIGPQDPGPQALGIDGSQFNPPAGHWRFTNGPGWCYTPEGIALTVTDVMRGEQFPCQSGRVTTHQREVRRRYRLLGALVVDQDVSGGRGSGVYLFGWVRGPTLGVTLVDRPQSEEDTMLLIAELPVAVEALDPWVNVPPALTTWAPIRLDGVPTLSLAPTNFRLDATEQAAFEFVPLPDMRLARVDALAIEFAAQGALGVDVWNWVDEVWETIVIDPATQGATIEDPSDLTGPENAVRVRVRLEDPALFNEVDYVKVGYYGALADVAPGGQG